MDGDDEDKKTNNEKCIIMKINREDKQRHRDINEGF